MRNLLDKIESPADIRHLSMNELKELCAELRDYMIECCSTNPGHLGSSLGAVELVVGIHYVFNTPEDKVVFDVGHQAYAHKILTGRKEIFRQNRKKDGISGFPKRSESIYDAFGAGHSSTSISAALGIAQAEKARETGNKTIALIGDGALSGGLAFEGLNNASEADLLMIINDNNISIDKNIGGIHEHLLNLTTHPTYNRLKDKVWNRMGEGKLREKIQRSVIRLKSNLVSTSGGDLFEALGLRYFGPVDGNDIVQVIGALQKLKSLKGPRVLHTITVKGKGYAPAEEDQTTWHAPGKFDPVDGKRLKNGDHKESRYQDVFGQVLLELARLDRRVVGVTPAMASGCGMNLLAREMPERFFDVGIAEEHAVTFSAGMASAGMKPFCNIYSSFSQRAYDQIIHDVALQHLGVVFCFDRAGLVGEDGATHHGCYDMAAYRSIPGVVIGVPSDEIELKRMMYTAYRSENTPFIIRYPRGYGEGAQWRSADFAELPVGKGEKICDGEGIAVIAAGPVVHRAVEAAEKCFRQTGERPYIYNIRYIKPADTSILDEAMAKAGTIITVEDGCVKGGLFGEVAEYAAQNGYDGKVIPVGIPDRFISQGTQEELRNECGIDRESLFQLFLREIRKRKEKSFGDKE